MNIQELQTIKHHNLPVKIFVWNNNGYLSIRATQRKFFEGRYIGTDSASGVSFPPLRKIASAYGLQYRFLKSGRNLAKKLAAILSQDGPLVCEVACFPDQEIIPTVASTKNPDGTIVSRPLEDMYPFLPREEFLAEMIIPPLKYG
jgi:acetolactate synthase-1/2/3 large subunit